MPIKCESCRHYTSPEQRPDYLKSAIDGTCSRFECLTHDFRRRGLTQVAVAFAREICDREGDGHFVYFEPKTPTAGAAFASGTTTSSTSTPTTPEMAFKAAA